MYNIDWYKVFEQIKSSFESVNSEEQKAGLAEVRDTKTELQIVQANCPRNFPSVRFNGTNFSLHPFDAEGIKVDPLKDTWSMCLRHYRL